MNSFISCVALIVVLMTTGMSLGQTEIPADNLRLWFKANDGVTKDSGVAEVASWANKAPSAIISAIPTTQAEKPTLVDGAINRYPAVRFNGSSNLLKTPAFDILAASNDASVFVVAKPANNQSPSATILDHDFRGPITLLPAVQPISVASRKAHGTSGSFDIPLPLTGTPGVECRSGGTNRDHQVIFWFATSVTMTGASVTSGIASVASTSTSTDGREITVNLTAVSNAQTVTVTLSNVNDGALSNDVGVGIGVLAGDVNASRQVDGNDVSSVQSATRMLATSANFRNNVTASGSISGNDVSFVQAQNRTGLAEVSPVPGFSLLQRGSSGNAYQFIFSSRGFTQGQDARGTALLKSEQAQIISVTKSGLSQVVRVNQAQTGFVLVASTMTQGQNVLSIGGSVSGTDRYFRGDIAEIIVYNRALSDAERQQVIDYLDQKYEISPSLPIPTAGLRAWFDAGTSLVKDATGLVSSWTDRINGITAQTTGLKPQWNATAAGGRPSIRFDGTNTVLRTEKVDLQGGSNDISVFTVLNPGSSQPSEVPVLDHDSNKANGFGISQNGATTNAYRLLFRSAGALQGENASAQLQAGQPRLLTAIKNGINESLYVDGTSVSSTAVASTMTTGSNILALGGSAGDDRRFRGDIAQILVYNRALSDAERVQVETYFRDTHALFATKFTFTLDASYPTSAGVYDATGRLIRTLWRNVTYGPGTISRSWDGKDDSGAAMSSGNYEIRVLYHNVVYVFEGAIGNTSTPSPSPGFNIHGGGGIHNLAVDGSNAFYVTNTDEGRTSLHYFDTGSTRQQKDLAHKDHVNFFDQVASDGQWVYFASRNTGYLKSTYYTFVKALAATGNHDDAQFTGGPPFVQDVTTDGDQNNPTWKYCIDVESSSNASNGNAATGLAVQKNGNVLAVAHGPKGTSEGEVRLFDKRTGVPWQPVSTISVPNPQGMAMAPNGDLWVIVGSAVRRYTSLNSNPTWVSTTSGTSAPVSVAVHPTDNDSVYVADGGSSQTVKRFNAAGQQQWVHGKPGGWYNASNGPDVAPDPSGQRSFGFEVGQRSNPVRHTPLAVQADGSFWIGDGATARLLHLTSTGTFIEQIAYLTHNVACSVDPNNPSRVIADDFLEYQVDYTKSLVDDPQSWTLKKNWAVGLPSRYLGGSLNVAYAALRSVVTLGSRTYALLADGLTPDPFNPLRARNAVVELPASGPLRVTGVFVDRVYTAQAFYGTDTPNGAPAQRASFESDGSLRYCRVEAGPKVVCYQRPVSFDASNNPQWGAATIIASAPYNDLDPWWEAEADPLNDTAHPITSSGVLVTLDPSTRGKPPLLGGSQFYATGFHLGGLPAGGDVNRWSWKASPGILSNVPFDGLGSFDIGDGVQTAVSAAPLAVGRNVVYDYFGEFWNQTQASQWMHFYDDGLFVGQFGTSGDQTNLLTRFGSLNNRPPLPGFAGFNAWASMVAVNGSNQKAPNGVNGETYIWSNDQNNYYGAVRWHMLGANTIREINGTGTLNSQITLASPGPVPYPTRLTATPGNGQVVLSWNSAAGAPTCNVRYSDRSGGPYLLLPGGAGVSGTSFTTSIGNGIRRYYIVSATNNDATPSNEVSAVAFNTVEKTGQLTGGPLTPWQVASSGVFSAQPALHGISSVLGNLIRNAIGTSGYVIYNWGGVDTNGNGVDAKNLAAGISVTKGGNWQNQANGMMNRFTIDGKLGEDGALFVDPAVTGTVDIGVSDTNTHYVTVFCPTLADGNPHAFTVQLKPRDSSSPVATYTVNDLYRSGDNHIFQFEFKGNVTLSVTNIGLNSNTVTNSLQAIFID